MTKNDAVYVKAKCSKTHNNFYMVYYKNFRNKWVLTYGLKNLPVGSSGGKNEEISIDLSSAKVGVQFACPDCLTKHWFTCWNCGQRSCYDGDNHDGRVVICAHCGESGVFRSSGSGNHDRKDKKKASIFTTSGQ